MNKANTLIGGLKIGLCLTVLAALTGCVGYVGPGDGGGAVVVGGPGYIDGPYYDGGFGGYYDRGHDARGFSGRGAASRAVAHGGFGGGHGGGGHGGGGRR